LFRALGRGNLVRECEGESPPAAPLSLPRPSLVRPPAPLASPCPYRGTNRETQLGGGGRLYTCGVSQGNLRFPGGSLTASRRCKTSMHLQESYSRSLTPLLLGDMKQ
jgi:hypothetical protein